jgi:DNA repair photolyase
MKKWGKQNPVRFDEKELNTDLGNGNHIFVGSSCDLFAPDIEAEYINKTLCHCKKFDNIYLFQTKNPRRLQFYDFPKDTVLCVTIESNYNLDKNYASSIDERVFWFSKFEGRKMITIEPIMYFDLGELLNIIESINPFQINIGADSGNNNLREPKKEDILELIKCLRDMNFTVFLKDNLKRLIK